MVFLCLVLPVAAILVALARPPLHLRHKRTRPPFRSILKSVSPLAACHPCGKDTCAVLASAVQIGFRVFGRLAQALEDMRATQKLIAASFVAWPSSAVLWGNLQCVPRTFRKRTPKPGPTKSFC